eukprot:365412-Chlamydomonas_euryale.AAC.24
MDELRRPCMEAHGGAFGLHGGALGRMGAHSGCMEVHLGHGGAFGLHGGVPGRMGAHSGCIRRTWAHMGASMVQSWRQDHDANGGGGEAHMARQEWGPMHMGVGPQAGVEKKAA